MLVRKNYPELGEVKAPYVHAVKHGDTLYVSGLTAFATTAQQADIAAQAEVIFQQLHTLAAQENTSLKKMHCATCFTGIMANTCPPVHWCRLASCFAPI